MKSIKYTLAALAVIAMASFSTAKAQAVSGPGDLILGVFNSGSSLEFDLGTYSSLTNGETFDLKNLVSSSFGGSISGLTYSLVGAGGSGGAGGLAGGQIVATGSKFPATVGGISTPQSNIAGLSAVNAVEAGGTNLAPAGANYAVYLDPSSGSASIYTKYNTSKPYGFGSSYTLGETYTGTDTVNFESLSGGVAPSLLGTFSFSTTDGDTVLTYNALSTPEPSAYALGLCAIALFWVLKRRSSLVA